MDIKEYEREKEEKKLLGKLQEAEDAVKGGNGWLSLEDLQDIVSDRIGIAKGQDLYDDEYDFDEMNPEIAKMFGGAEQKRILKEKGERISKEIIWRK